MGSIDNWLSDIIQNEVIQQFDQSVQTNIVSRAVKCSFYRQADDGPTHVCIIEQFSLNSPTAKTPRYFLVHNNLTEVD